LLSETSSGHLAVSLLRAPQGRIRTARLPSLASPKESLAKRLVLLTLAFGLVLSTLVAVTGGAGAAPAAAPAAQQGSLKTTAALNLREGPGTGYRVLVVIPKNAHVFDHGETSNGFRKVTYNNTRGWAYAAFLAPGSSVPPHPGPVIGKAVVAVVLNLRAGPSTGDPVLRAMPKGALVDVTDTVVDGFRYVYHNGTGGWAFAQFLAPAGGESPAYFTTTAAVNLRAQPNSSAAIKLVVPAGAVVVDIDLAPLVNGYRGVAYNGTVGWVYDAYLR
jgi:uncharacterized protein YraI